REALEAMPSSDAFCDEKQPTNARGARDNFLSAAVLGNMVSLGSDAGNAGMMAVRHARLIQQLILASGNEASKAYEKWQRRGKTTVAYGSKTNNEDFLQNDVRKAGNKLRQRRRGNLLARLETTEVVPATSETRLRRGTSTQEINEAQTSGEPADEDDTSKSEESDEDSSSDATTSSTSSDDSEDEVPGLGFMRVAGRSGRRASLNADQMPMLAQRKQRGRAALRQPSVVARESSTEVRKQRQSQVGHWGQLAGLARMMMPMSHDQGARASILFPDGSGGLGSARRLSEGKSEDQNEADAPDESGDSRRKLPEVFGIHVSKSPHRTMQWQEPVATLKRLHLDVAARLGLDAEAGDWDPDQTYQMSIAKFEELAEQKLLRRQQKAAIWIQARWRSQRIRRPLRQVIYKRLEARHKIRAWIRKVLRRKKIADKMVHLRMCIISTIKIQANVRRWLVKKEMGSAVAFHQVQFRMAALQERLYPAEERERDREANERLMMSEEEELSQRAESARRKHEADRQRAVAVLQPAVRRWLSRVKCWRLLQEREKELNENKRYRRFRDRDDDEYRPLSRSTFASGPRSGIGSVLEPAGVKKVGSGGDGDFARSLGSQAGEGHPGVPGPSFWHGPSGKALLALEVINATVAEHRSSGSQARGFRARAYRTRASSIALPPAPPGFRSDIAGARGGPKRGTPRLVSVPPPVGRKVKETRSSAED
ncbi:unnamed protein product, partial [Cladocopium goreaui]